MFTKREVEQINRTRVLMKNAMHRCTNDTKNEQFDLGRVNEACDAAEERLFNVLNCTGSYLNDMNADAGAKFVGATER